MGNFLSAQPQQQNQGTFIDFVNQQDQPQQDQPQQDKPQQQNQGTFIDFVNQQDQQNQLQQLQQIDDDDYNADYNESDYSQDSEMTFQDFESQHGQGQSNTFMEFVEENHQMGGGKQLEQQAIVDLMATLQQVKEEGRNPEANFEQLAARLQEKQNNLKRIRTLSRQHQDYDNRTELLR